MSKNEIKMSAIITDKNYDKLEFHKEYDEALLASMRGRGLVNPIVVMPASGDKYLLVEGRRRLLMARVLKWKEIPAVEIKPLTDEEIAEINIIASAQHVPMQLGDYRKAVKRLLEMNKDMTLHTIAERIEKPVEWLEAIMME